MEQKQAYKLDLTKVAGNGKGPANAKGLTGRAGMTPKGIPGYLDKGARAEVMPKDRTGNKGGAKDTKMWKKNMGPGRSIGHGEAETHSGEVGPTPCKDRSAAGQFTTDTQREEFSNAGGGRTRFVN